MSNMDKTTVDIKLGEFVEKESKFSQEARCAFADQYSNHNKDLPTLFEAIFNETPETSLYFKGLAGEEFESVGPVVPLGPPPFPNAPAAHEEWVNYASYLGPASGAGGQPSFLFMHEICGKMVQLMHLTKGVCVLTTEHALLQKYLLEYLKEELKMCETLALCQMTIRHLLVRMLWPGRTSLVYSNPIPGRKQNKPDFHHTRMEIANQYFNQVLAEVAATIRTTPKTATMTKMTKKVPKGGKRPKEGFLNRKVFATLRDKAYSTFAAEIGFGEPWTRKYFQKRTTQGLKKLEDLAEKKKEEAKNAPKQKAGKGKGRKKNNKDDDEEPAMTDTVAVDVFRHFPDPTRAHPLQEGEEPEDESDNDDDAQDQ